MCVRAVVCFFVKKYQGTKGYMDEAEQSLEDGFNRKGVISQIFSTINSIISIYIYHAAGCKPNTTWDDKQFSQCWGSFLIRPNWMASGQIQLKKALPLWYCSTTNLANSVCFCPKLDDDHPCNDLVLVSRAESIRITLNSQLSGNLWCRLAWRGQINL